MPKLKHTVMVKNPNTGVENEVVIEGLQSFLGWPFHMIVLSNYFKTNFNLMTHYNYSLSELDNMMPWEREIYVGLMFNI